MGHSSIRLHTSQSTRHPWYQASFHLGYCTCKPLLSHILSLYQAETNQECQNLQAIHLFHKYMHLHCMHLCICLCRLILKGRYTSVDQSFLRLLLVSRTIYAKDIVSHHYIVSDLQGLLPNHHQLETPSICIYKRSYLTKWTLREC